MNTPILETERLNLRPFAENDAPAVFKGWESDPDVAKYMFWSSHHDIEKTKQWIKEEISKISLDDWFRWAIVCKDTNQVMNCTILYGQHKKPPCVGI